MFGRVVLAYIDAGFESICFLSDRELYAGCMTTKHLECEYEAARIKMD